MCGGWWENVDAGQSPGGHPFWCCEWSPGVNRVNGTCTHCEALGLEPGWGVVAVLGKSSFPGTLHTTATTLQR